MRAIRIYRCDVMTSVLGGKSKKKVNQIAPPKKISGGNLGKTKKTAGQKPAV